MKEKKFKKSDELLERALKIIPQGTQTLSKSAGRMPKSFPKYLQHGNESIVVDVDGNTFVDVSSALGAVSLGYGNPEVDRAIKDNVLSHGNLYTLPSVLEVDLAEVVLDLIPYGEMVRFAKNGSDVATAAVRLARKKTGNRLILRHAYHGWHDWNMVGLPKWFGGVLPDVMGQVRSFNSLEELEKLFLNHRDKVACVIVDCSIPINLAEVKRLCRHNFSVFIADEILSGFRYDLRGECFKKQIEPDLALFGKAMGNGYPIAMLMGSRDLMGQLEDDVFFSTTYGGDTIGIQAALTTIDYMKRHNVVEYLINTGLKFLYEINKTNAKTEMQNIISVKEGSPSLIRFNFRDDDIRKLFIMKMADFGVLTNGTVIPMFAHTGGTIDTIKYALVDTITYISQVIKEENGVKYALEGGI